VAMPMRAWRVTGVESLLNTSEGFLSASIARAGVTPSRSGVLIWNPARPQGWFRQSGGRSEEMARQDEATVPQTGPRKGGDEGGE
jgi:hypothetical protein